VARFDEAAAVTVGWWGAHQPQMDVAFPLAGGGALAQVARSGAAARVADYAALGGDAIVRIAQAASYHSAVAAPVRVAGRLWGAVLAATTRAEPIAAGAEQRLSGFAELLGVAIANALASQQADRQASIHRAVLETAHDAFVAIDAAGDVCDWNPQAEAVFGWTRAEAIGRGLDELIIPPGQRGAARRLLERFVATGDGPALHRRQELVALHRDGHEFPVEVTVSALALDGGYRFSAFARDISARKRAERYVGAQHAVTRVLAESASLEEARPRILEALGTRLGWDLGMLWSVDPRNRCLRCDDVWSGAGLDAEPPSREMVLSPAAGLPGAVWATGEPAWLDDSSAQADSPQRRAAARRGLRSAIALPIRSRGEVLAVIEFARRDRWRPDPELIAMMATIGSQLGQFFERKRAEREAERLKDEFFALVSHELRTPLTSISGYLEILLEEDENPVSDHQRRHFLGVIDRNARRLERLVGDLLFVARLEEGRLRLDPSAVDLNRLAGEAIEVAAPMAEQRGIRLRLACEPIPLFQGDPGRLGQSLDNLLSNALKFTPCGGRVDVRLSRRGDLALIEVRDSGVGIPEAEQGRLFERFFRASTATEQAIPGVGLGLTIVKAIVEGHGGAIVVESQEGLGATFRLELPLAPPVSEGLNAPAPRTSRPAAPQRQSSEPVSLKLAPAIGTKRQS
jgi:PAS domain S-box-containing protein